MLSILLVSAAQKQPPLLISVLETKHLFREVLTSGRDPVYISEKAMSQSDDTLLVECLGCSYELGLIGERKNMGY